MNRIRLDGKYLVLLVIGVLLLMIAALLRLPLAKVSTAEFFGTVAQDTAFAFITVGVLSLLWTLMGGDPTAKAIDQVQRSLEFAQDGARQGILRFHPDAQNMPDFWHTFVDTVSREDTVRISGPVLADLVLTDVFREGLKALLVDKRCHVEMLILHPGNPDLWSFERNNSLSPKLLRAELMEVINRLLIERAQLDNGYSDKFEIRTVQRGSFGWTSISSSGQLVAVPLIRSAAAPSAPLLELRTDLAEGLCKRIMGDCDFMWKTATSLTHPESSAGKLVPPSSIPLEKLVNEDMLNAFRRLRLMVKPVAGGDAGQIVSLEREIANALMRYLPEGHSVRCGFFYEDDRKDFLMPSGYTRDTWGDGAGPISLSNESGKSLIGRLRQGGGNIVLDHTPNDGPLPFKGSQNSYAYCPIRAHERTGMIYIDDARTDCLCFYDLGLMQVLASILACAVL